MVPLLPIISRIMISELSSLSGLERFRSTVRVILLSHQLYLMVCTFTRGASVNICQENVYRLRLMPLNWSNEKLTLRTLSEDRLNKSCNTGASLSWNHLTYLHDVWSSCNREIQQRSNHRPIILTIRTLTTPEIFTFTLWSGYADTRFHILIFTLLS